VPKIWFLELIIAWDESSNAFFNKNYPILPTNGMLFGEVGEVR